MHPAEAGGLSSLVAVVGLGHGVGDVLDDGEVGADLPLGLALELAPGELVGEPGGCGPLMPSPPQTTAPLRVKTTQLSEVAIFSPPGR